MEEIQLENEAVYWLGSVISFAEVDIRKSAATEKLKEHFQLTYDRKTLRIEVKASWGLSEEVFGETNSLLYSQKYPYGLLWDIFNHVRNLIKDTHRENTVKGNFSSYKKYEYGHLSSLYIKSTLYKRGS